MLLFRKIFLCIMLLGFAGQAMAQTFQYGATRASSLDVYLPDNAQNAPVLFYVHGGAWMIGDKRRIGAKAEHFTQAGLVFISVNYTLVPRGTVEGQLNEIDQALGWVYENAGRFGGNAANIHLMGHSAGAHLVTMAAVAPQQHAAEMLRRGDIRTVISNDTRAYDIVRIAAEARGGRLPRLYQRPFGLETSRWRALSPIYHAARAQNLPDFLLLYSNEGRGATRQAFARDFGAVLERAGADVTLYDGRAFSHREISQGIGVNHNLTAAIDHFLGDHM